MARLLREGLPQGQRSERIWAFLVWAVNSGWSFEATLALLMDASNALGEKVREKRAPRRWLEAQWNKAERFVATNPPVADRGAVLAEVARLRQGVEEDDWPGVAGTTDRQIVLVHLDIMEETGKLYHGASVREVAERAGRSAKTVTASHERQRDRWLKPAGPHRRGTMEARIWTVQTPPGSNRRRRKVTSVLTLRGGVREIVVIPRLGSLHDAFRGRGGLGLGPGLAYDVLGVVDRVDVAALIKRFGGHRSTWYRRLGRLAEHGLATRTPPGWLRGPADLDQVAEALGVAGALARQKAQHHQERKTFKEWLNEGRPLKKGARGPRRGTALDGPSAHGIV
jgi:transposase